jgi:hypothetical protein
MGLRTSRPPKASLPSFQHNKRQRRNSLHLLLRFLDSNRQERSAYKLKLSNMLRILSRARVPYEIVAAILATGLALSVPALEFSGRAVRFGSQQIPSALIGVIVVMVAIAVVSQSGLWWSLRAVGSTRTTIRLIIVGLITVLSIAGFWYGYAPHKPLFT